MIRNFWYAILPSNELKKKPLGLTRLGEKLVLWRSEDNAINCISDICAHRGAALSHGQIIHDHIECPFHGIRYDGSGMATLIPANGKSAKIPEYFKTIAYPAQEKHGFIWIFWGDKKDNIPELRFYDNLIDDDFHYVTVTSHWNVHYSRCIENQLDEVHVPFVHRTTIGRGNRTLIHGPLVVPGDNDIKFYVKYDLDNGQKPMKAEDFPEPKPGDHYLHFLFPNMWQNVISDKLRVFITFTPIDEDNSILYTRTYQKFMRVPLMKYLVTSLAMKFGNIVLEQDRRVVVTQEPRKTWLGMPEKLIPGDTPVIQYRVMRDKLIKENNKE